MLTKTRRPGTSRSRIHDLHLLPAKPRTKPGVLVLGLDSAAKGGTYFPVVFASWRGGKGYNGGRGFRVTVPHITWATGYRFRRFGLLQLHLLQARLIGAIVR
jgi:hypothetical protein